MQDHVVLGIRHYCGEHKSIYEVLALRQAKVYYKKSSTKRSFVFSTKNRANQMRYIEETIHFLVDTARRSSINATEKYATWLRSNQHESAECY
jgi:GT2 family glycosyltransferase